MNPGIILFSEQWLYGFWLNRIHFGTYLKQKIFWNAPLQYHAMLDLVHCTYFHDLTPDLLL